MARIENCIAVAPRNLRPGPGFACGKRRSRAARPGDRAQRLSKGERNMKRMIAGVLLLIGMGAGTMFAEDGFWRDRRDIRHDEARIARERRELRRDLDYGNYAAARHERRELRHNYHDLNWDRRDLYWDRR